MLHWFPLTHCLPLSSANRAFKTPIYILFEFVWKSVIEVSLLLLGFTILYTRKCL